MTPFSKKFMPAYGRVLLKIAEGDLNSAKVLSTNAAGRPENTCYLAQQAVEKTLKAVICHLGQPVPMTHDIAALLAALPESSTRPPSETGLVALSEFATVRRYENGYYELPPEEIQAAVRAAGDVVAWAKSVIK